MTLEPTRLRLRLANDATDTTPVGLIPTPAAVPELLAKLRRRGGHYGSLHLAAIAEGIVVLSPDGRNLPWHADIRYFLHRCGPVLCPVGLRLDVPGTWHDAVAMRLAHHFGLATPLLILPPDEPDAPLRIADLAGARSLATVDLAVLAREYAA